jgi:hypothetical protein
MSCLFFLGFGGVGFSVQYYRNENIEYKMLERLKEISERVLVAIWTG